MSGSILTLLLILATAFLARRLRADTRRRIAAAYGIGAALSLVGCGGALAWLGAETSGRGNPFHAVNPYLWSGLFAVGVMVLVATSMSVLAARAERVRSGGPSEDGDAPAGGAH